LSLVNLWTFYLDYFFFFSEIWQSFSAYDTILLFVTMLVLIKLPAISSEYRYFVFSMLIFLLISFIGWVGFTLNFLILFILYSTLIVIFWIFSIGFEDFELKKETSDSGFAYYFCIFFFFWSLNLPVTTIGNYSNKFIYGDTYLNFFFLNNEFSEFLIIYLSLFFYHFISIFCFFFALIVICKVIVSLLLIKYKIKFTNAHQLNYKYQAKTIGTSLNRRTSSVFSYFSRNIPTFKKSKKKNS